MPAIGDEKLPGLREPWRHSRVSQAGKFQPSGRTALFKAERAAAVEDRTSPAPIELVQLAIYRSASQRTRMRLIRAWQTSAWMTLVRQIQSRDI